MSFRLSAVLLFLALPISIISRVDLGGGHMGLAQTDTCPKLPSSYSCTELDDDWPDQGLSCPEAHHDIPRHTLAIMSATMIQLGKYKPLQKSDFPVDECYTSAPNSTTTAFGFISQGTFDMWFFAHDKCDCEPGKLPQCNDRATEAQKCNLRTFTLCKVTKKGFTCKPKHHDGWKPLPAIEDKIQKTKEPTEIETEPETVFGQQQQSFNIHDRKSFSFMSGWWKLLELLGIFGVI
ncbi:uncharacterized protein MELLADRAFT_73322 [Melampsora larici-populina 98AG31]|uniref:Secreted protein n=1 Tax=Melampsora larici-populina (strain 98AG31 / pathotype 3-4-7) TaxID=747676 RepID=F4S6D9_MELLP|nr:uncharacterized protein MELLADRAFT_73322 [Melampsora larici-populina 98AG31]EGF99812.1 secreted protein [Melampsora larici-populina 98AG31]